MENPATWGPLEQAIDGALREAEQQRAEGLVGLSDTRIVADAVRELLEAPAKAAGFASSEIRRVQGLISREVVHDA